MSGLLVSQIAFLAIFLIKKLNPIRSYILDFKVSEFKTNGNKAFPPRKNNNKRYLSHKKVNSKKEDLVLEDIDNEDKKNNLKDELKKKDKNNKLRLSTISELVT